MRKVMLLAVVLGVIAPLVAPPPPAAEAQRKRKQRQKKPEDPQQKIRKEADRHFKNGVRLFSEQKYAEALAEFEQAYALEPHPLVLYNLASAHRALSQYSQAVDFYNRFLLEGDGKVRDQQLGRARSELEALLELVASVEVNTRPEGARVAVDGREIGESPLGSDVILGPGDHVVEAHLEGYQPLTRRFRVAAGDELRLDLELEPVAGETSAGPDVAVELPRPGPRPRRIGVSAAMGTNALEISRTGAPVVGVGYAFTDRVSVGVDVVLVAYAAVPGVRYRLFGDAFSVHAIAAMPVSFGNGDDGSTFVTGAGGLGVRYRPADALAIRLETWVSYGGAERGTTMPAFAAAELWF